MLLLSKKGPVRLRDVVTIEIGEVQLQDIRLEKSRLGKKQTTRYRPKPLFLLFLFCLLSVWYLFAPRRGSPLPLVTDKQTSSVSSTLKPFTPPYQYQQQVSKEHAIASLWVAFDKAYFKDHTSAESTIVSQVLATAPESSEEFTLQLTSEEPIRIVSRDAEIGDIIENARQSSLDFAERGTNFVRFFSYLGSVVARNESFVSFVFSDGDSGVDSPRQVKRYVDESCRSGEAFRQTHPFGKFVCLESGKHPQSRRVHNCFCDLVLRVSSEDGSVPSEALSVLESFLDSSSDDKPNPCEQINELEDRRLHLQCRKTKPSSLTSHPMVHVPLFSRFQCSWTKSEGCVLHPKLIHFSKELW